MKTRITPELQADYIQKGYWTLETLGDYFARAVEKYPEKIAVVDPYRKMTYRELATLCTGIIRGLCALGVQGGDPVAYQLPNRVEGHAVHNALRTMGAVVCPLIPIFREKEVGYILGHTGAKAVFIPDAFGGRDYIAMYKDLRAELPALEHIIVIGDVAAEGMMTFQELLSSGAGHGDVKKLNEYKIDPGAVCSIYFTSGTTADPKGVQHTNQTLLRDGRVAIDTFGLTDKTSVFMPSTIGHLTGFAGLEIPIMLGAKAVYLDVFNAEDAGKMISRERCDMTVGATPFLQWLVESEAGRLYDLSCMRNFICGGAYIPAEIIKKAPTVGMRAVRTYGMTESPSVTLGIPDDPEDITATTDGRIVPGMAVKIIGEDGNEVIPGREGEIIVKGPETFIGYTDQSLNKDAFSHDGYFYSGDMGRMVNGAYILVTGRKKDIIIRGGENISVKELEDTLYRHPAIEQAAVVAMPDSRFGEKACAYVKVRRDHLFTFEMMTMYFMSQKMAKQKIPERLEILEEFPMNASGKILKVQLRKMIAEKLRSGIG